MDEKFGTGGGILASSLFAVETREKLTPVLPRLTIKRLPFKQNGIVHGWLALLLSLASAQAFTGATVPWTTYEAETMTVSGGTILGPQYGPNMVASESSGRQCVQLNATGQYVQFTAQAAANAIVVRYSVPDNTSGTGTNYTLGLYTNGVLATRLSVTSKYSWLYGSYPFTKNAADGYPRNFYDEVHTNNLTIKTGDTVRLQKDGVDTATNYVIDFVELEIVPAASSQPGGSASIKSAPYNAAGDGITDDTTALQNCLNANTNVWLPPGNYKITGTINLPANRTLQGAGIWYAALVGDATLYTNSARRVALNGNGTNLHLADFAISGKLNYRNDSEPNDGITGTFGTNSGISRLWIEHTKTGLYPINSQGLFIDSCRIRDTIADGIGLVVGMNGTTVTNCTVRGAGDDSFAIWPATWTPQTFSPGLNVITHCTAQNSFLGSGGAIYGGNGNRIEDCLFEDFTYGCGILISTTFAVGGNVFSGTTVAQRSDLIRCGGYDPNYQWRAAVQLCLDSYGSGIPGLNLNHLNLTNSISDGLSVIGGTGTLSNAVASYLNIVNCGLGTNGCTALWARSDTFGSLTVSNSLFANYQDDSANFSFNLLANTGPAVALAFTTQPGSAAANVPFSQQPVLKSVDAAGNPSSLGLPANLQVFVSLTNGSGRLLGTTNFDIGTSAGNGVAAFTNLAIDTASTNVQLVATTGSAAFGSPVAGMSIWLDGSATSSVLTNASGSVTNWLDQSGNGNHFNITIGSGGNGIRYTNTAAFGRKTVTFNATGGTTGTELKNTTYTNVSKTVSVFVVARKNAAGIAEGQYQHVFATWAGGANPDYADGGSYSLDYAVSNTTPRIIRSGGIVDNDCPVMDPSTNYHAFEYVATGTGSNGVWNAMSGTTTQGAGPNFGNVSANFNVVASSVGGGLINGTTINNPFAGSIAEVLVYSSALSSFDRTAVENYLRSKWIAPYVLTKAASATFNISASAPPAQPIIGAAVSGQNGFTLTFGATPGFTYHVEVTTNLAPASWSTVSGSTTNAAGGSVTFTDTNRSGTQRFYRTVSP